MSIKRKIFIPITVILSLVFFSITAFASTYPSNSNSDNSKWHFPYTGYMEGYKYTSGSLKWIHAQVYGKYNSAQITNMRNTTYYPTLEIKDSTQMGNYIEGQYYSSNYPDPKYDVDYCGPHGEYSCEIEVANKNNNLMVAETNYYISTEWKKKGTSDVYLIAYGSQSREPTLFECSIGQCELNTVSSQFSALSGFNVNSASGSWASTGKTIDNKLLASSKVTKNSVLGNTTMVDIKSDLPKDLNKEYVSISEISTLEAFASKANKKANEVNNSEEYDFIITFNNTINREELLKYKNMTVLEPLIYGRGYNQLNERITIAVSGFDDQVLQKAEEDSSYKFKGFTQIAGKTKGENIKRIIGNKEIFSIEVASENIVPLGLYWKLEDLKQQ